MNLQLKRVLYLHRSSQTLKASRLSLYVANSYMYIGSGNSRRQDKNPVYNFEQWEIKEITYR